jgi:ribosomal protein S18 acetylase RimI-like enzyme
MSISTKSLINVLDDVKILFEEINRFWINKHGYPDIAEPLKQKIDQIINSKTQGTVVYDNNKPVSIGLVENITKHYSNIIVYSIAHKYHKVLVESIYNLGLLNNKLTELIKFEDSTGYQKHLTKVGLIPNIRQRMAKFLDNDTKFVKPNNISFSKIKKKELPISAEISYKAHQISNDYQGYPDLDSLENRINLEKLLFQEVYGKVVKPACLFLKQNNNIVGSCTVVEISCWGYEKVPWIFDICILPKFQGQRLGSLLFNKVLSVLYKQNYPIVGLAVTKSNKNALHIYQKLNFTFVEEFYEFGSP